MRLYDIKQAYDEILERAVDPETGEVDEDVLAELAKVEDDLYEKIDNIGAMIKNLKAEADAEREEARRLTARARTAENTIERMKSLLAYCLDGKSYKTPRAAVSFRHTQVVEVTDLELIPEEYLTFKEPVPDKKKIREALEDGELIEGAKMVDNLSTIIR